MRPIVPVFDRRSAPLKVNPDLRPTSAYCICTPRFSTLDAQGFDEDADTDPSPA